LLEQNRQKILCVQPDPVARVAVENQAAAFDHAHRQLFWLALVDLEEHRVADRRWLAADCDPLVLAVSLHDGVGKTGQDVVYRLPWYLVIGPQGSGKSSLVYKSGLSFPYSDPDRSLASRGIGPTQNCDLWIANEAFFIDVAGRYSLVEGDKETWLGFLDQIKRLRRDKPLDGILLTVDIASLLRAGNDERRDLAKKLRARLDEMTQRLGMLVPVYLLFSKSDQLEGFEEFFRDLAPEELGQVWGCTFRKEQYQSLQSHQEFQKELDLLCSVLRCELVPRRCRRPNN